MIYKLFIEEGDWIDIATGERRNLLEANIAWTPEGENVGWTQFSSKEECAQAWGLTPWIDPDKIDDEDAQV